MPPTVYIESSIPSFYFSTRTSAKSVAWRQITRSWWHDQSPHFELVTSGTVKDELSTSPGEKSRLLMDLVSSIRVLEFSPMISVIAEQYVRNKLTPRSPDAAHLAFASVYALDYLLTWNCVHLANANKARHIKTINDRLGLHTPMIVTPLTLLAEVPDEEDH